ncbi:hypothetical protein AVEN_35614-1 [Araneus ventricosus]|uniref:Uncharacterized protein n=1 Tax=Araneus ventricosus TaxID=182803 RepID=A0A4Y2CJ30_ARAVE|nr:hypothetical protein AVEN_35614-1 [Araneus ventricosus]
MLQNAGYNSAPGGNQSIQAVTTPCGDLSTDQALNTSFISLMKSLEFCQGCGIEEDYKELMPYIVCEGAGRECMLRHCDKCPSKDNLVQFLQSKFEDYDEEDVIEYLQSVGFDFS